MADESTRFLRASDNALDYANSLIEGLDQKAHEDIDHLMRETTDRDEEFWAEVGVDADTVLSDFDDEPILERDLNWSLGLAGMAAASGYQFFLDNRDDTIINPVAYREQVLSPFDLTREQLIAAGKRGFEFENDPIYQKLRAEFLDDLAFMKDVPDKELYNLLLEFDAIRPIDQAIADAHGYVARMTNFPPGSPQFKEAVSDLVNYESTRALKGANRRAIENIYTARQVGGDVNKLMVWIVEGGKNTCSACRPRAGQVETYLRWLELGTPGSQVCLGGDACRCGLAAI